MTTENHENVDVKRARRLPLRLVLSSNHQDLPRELNKCEIHVSEVSAATSVLEPSQSICPGDSIAVIIKENASHELRLMRWGLPVPRRASSGPSIRPFACAENVKKSIYPWKTMRGRERCVIICNGYHHWRYRGGDPQQVFCDHKYLPVVFLAGLYQRASNNSGDSSCVVITQLGKSVESAEKDRFQPVVLSNEVVSTWLDTYPNGWDERLDTLLPNSEKLGSGLRSKPVGLRTATLRSNSPSMILPDKYKLDDIISGFTQPSSSSPPALPDQSPQKVLRPRSSTTGTGEFEVPPRTRPKRKHDGEGESSKPLKRSKRARSKNEAK